MSDVTKADIDSDIDPVSSALAQRLRAAAPHLLPGGADLDTSAGPLLKHLVLAARGSRRDEDLWLLIVAITGRFPEAEHVRGARAALRHSTEADATLLLLSELADLARHSENLRRPMVVIEEATVVDVDFCARHDHNTGIQRVVRQTMSRWADAYAPTFVAWTDFGHAMREIGPYERKRVVDWGTKIEGEPEGKDELAALPIVVPLRSNVLVSEVPRTELCLAQTAISEFSGNTVHLIGYDAIPIVSADTVPHHETERFVRYLNLVKHATRVLAISDAVAEEFSGFAMSVTAQGLSGPKVVSVPLPVDIPDARPASDDVAPAGRLVLCVGSHEPRKNHHAVLFAAELLWNEGLQFSLRFVGGGSIWYTRIFDKQVKRLQKAGRDVQVLRGVSDEEMLALYREATFSVFPSLQEGFGLPVAESLALNTPVITTSYGSTGEIARDGGCLTVDPRDDESIVTAMRELLTNQERVQELQREIAHRPRRSWDAYAHDLASHVVGGRA